VERRDGVVLNNSVTGSPLFASRLEEIPEMPSCIDLESRIIIIGLDDAVKRVNM